MVALAQNNGCQIQQTNLSAVSSYHDGVYRAKFTNVTGDIGGAYVSIDTYQPEIHSTVGNVYSWAMIDKNNDPVNVIDQSDWAQVGPVWLDQNTLTVEVQINSPGVNLETVNWAPPCCIPVNNYQPTPSSGQPVTSGDPWNQPYYTVLFNPCSACGTLGGFLITGHTTYQYNVDRNSTPTTFLTQDINWHPDTAEFADETHNLADQTPGDAGINEEQHFVDANYWFPAGINYQGWWPVQNQGDVYNTYFGVMKRENPASEISDLGAPDPVSGTFSTFDSRCTGSTSPTLAGQ